MPIARAKGVKAKCDKLFSQIVRSVGACEKCGSTDWLQTSHIVSRRYSATRCDRRNAQCLCAGCHRFFTLWPKEFSRWITASIGVELYEELKLKAETVTKTDWSEVYTNLQTLAKNLD
jgi:5-methylcytosine-specific restriction endonuclease McrA